MLLALYFFLAGCMVSQNRMMWVVPAASALFACLFAMVLHGSSMLSSTYRQALQCPCSALTLASPARGKAGLNSLTFHQLTAMPLAFATSLHALLCLRPPLRGI